MANVDEVKGKKTAPKPVVKQCCTASESESDGSESSSAKESDDEVEVQNNKAKGKVKSRLYAKPCDAKLVLNEWYAHTALDEMIDRDRIFENGLLFIS